MLIEGFPLDSTIEQEQIGRNTLYHVSSDFCEHTLRICLDNNITDNAIEKININEGETFICLDSALTDQTKIRLEDKGLVKTI